MMMANSMPPQPDLVAQLAAAIAAEVDEGGSDEIPELRDFIGKVAEDLGPKLADMAASAECSVGGYQAQTLADYLEKHQEASLFVMARLDAPAAFVLLRLPHRTLDWWLSATLGGEPSQRMRSPGGISTIEARVGRVIVDYGLGALGRVLSSHGIDVSFHESRIATSAADVPKLRDHPWCHCVSLELCRGHDHICMDIVIPEGLAVSWCDQVASRGQVGDASSGEGTPDAGDWRDRLEFQVEATRVRLEAVIEQSIVDLGAVSRWSVGMMIPLSVTVGSLVVLQSEDVPLFRCELGKKGKNMSLRVAAPIDPDQAFFEDILDHQSA